MHNAELWPPRLPGIDKGRGNGYNMDNVSDL